jgi:hypothetical protein
LLIPADKLGGHSRVWIYQADRALNDEEVQRIESVLSTFVSNWKAHGHPVQGSAQVLHNHFLLIYADEEASGVSGCSIDGSVRLIQELGREMQIDFFNRLNLVVQDAEAVRVIPRMNLEAEIEAGQVTAETLVFDNLVATKADLEASWQKPLRDTWAASALPA